VRFRWNSKVIVLLNVTNLINYICIQQRKICCQVWFSYINTFNRFIIESSPSTSVYIIPFSNVLLSLFSPTPLAVYRSRFFVYLHSYILNVCTVVIVVAVAVAFVFAFVRFAICVFVSVLASYSLCGHASLLLLLPFTYPIRRRRRRV